MSVTVTGTGDPAVRGGPALGGRWLGGRWRGRLSLSTTPGRLRLALIGLVTASLAWGALAGFSVSQYSSAATSVSTTSEPLTFDAQQIYHHLSDANDTEATAFLTGGLQPFTLVNRYNQDIAAAGAALEDATARGGGSADLAALSKDLPVYASEIGTARADSRLGYPLGAAYLREASNLMNNALLPAAERLYTADNAKLAATSAQATGLPLILFTVAAGLALGYALYRTSRWLTRRTNRVVNQGLLAAAAAGLISLAWLTVAFGGAYFDLQAARTGGALPVQALARADIVALQAHADESLTLIDDAGNDQYEDGYSARIKQLNGTLLPAAVSSAAGSPAAGQASAAASGARAWNTAHATLRQLDDNTIAPVNGAGGHADAVASALGNLRSNDAGHEFSAFSAAITRAISADQQAFEASASAGGAMYTALEAAVIVLSLVMAAGCAWGLSQRLVEYR